MSFMNEIKAILDSSESKQVKKQQILEYHPYEISEVLQVLSDENRYRLYKIIPTKDMAEIISFVDEEDVLELFEGMKPRYIVDLITELEIDDAVDIMSMFDDKTKAAYLRLMNENHREQIKTLLSYDEDSAGGVMTTEYIVVSVKDTIETAMKKMLKQAGDTENIDTIFVCEAKSTLVGIVSLRELIIARKGEFIKDIMHSKIISVNVHDDQEDAASIFKDYDITSLPVLDHLGRLLGIITVDDIIDVIEEEALEDYSKLAAVSDADIDNDDSIFKSASKRLPWLLVLSVLGFLTSLLISSFEEALEGVPTIALFMPMILGMAGNTGTQSLAVTVRGLNNNEFENKKHITKHLLREIGTGLLNGVLIGIILFFVTYLLLLYLGSSNILEITQVVSLSIVLSLAIATFSGALIPIIINSFNIDPAIASGPFVTMVVDIIALTVYFSLATTLILNM